MTRTTRQKPSGQARTGRRLRAQILRRDATGLDLLSQAFVGLAQARNEQQAEAEHKGAPKRDERKDLDERIA